MIQVLFGPASYGETPGTPVAIGGGGGGDAAKPIRKSVSAAPVDKGGGVYWFVIEDDLFADASNEVEFRATDEATDIFLAAHLTSSFPNVTGNEIGLICDDNNGDAAINITYIVTAVEDM